MASARAFERARSGERDALDCCAMSASRWAISQIAPPCPRSPPPSTTVSPWCAATRRGRWAGWAARPRGVTWSRRSGARATPGCWTSARRRWRPAGHSSSRQRFDGRPLFGSGQHEQQVRESVRVAEHFRIVQLTALLEADDAALRASQHRARDIQGGRRLGATWNHEGIRQRNAALEVDDLELDPTGEVGRDDHEVLLQLAVLGRVSRQLGADREQLALNAQDDRVPAAVLNQGARRPQCRDGLIDSAVRLRARIRLFHAPAVEKPGLSPIAGLGDDALSCDGDSYAAPRASTSCVHCCNTLRWLANASGGNPSGRNQPTCCTSSPAAARPAINPARYARSQ